MRPECASAASLYALALPRTPFGGGIAGERMGSGVGSSLEFMDFRDYQPGDDLRHVDWRTYARTDQMKVRLYREEITPALDVILDLSRSMATTEAKERSARDLCGALDEWMRAAAGGRGVRFYAAGGGPVDAAAGLPEFGSDPSGLIPRTPLRPRSLRLVLSDFLGPDDPGPALRRLGADASHLWVLQLLDPWELDPEREGPRTLVDVETGARLELVLDDATVTAYRSRLKRLCGAVEHATRALGGSYVQVTADTPATMFRRDLLRGGVIEPR